MQPIVPPNKCPACQAATEMRAGILYCTSDSCSSQGYKRVEHFAKVMKIKGLGPATIEKLGITDPLDLYFELGDLETVLSAKVASNLREELERSCTQPLEVVISALGITLLGLATATKLVGICKHLEDITRPNCELAGLGPKVTDYLLSYDFTKLKASPLNLTFSEGSTKSQKAVVCITGKLNSFKTKAEATKALEAAGYKVSASISKDVTILINEGGVESSKTQKARNSGIKIVTNIGDLI